MLRLLERQRRGKEPAETPRELSQRLEASGYAAAAQVEAITTAFETSRYAMRPATESQVAVLESALREIRKAG